MPPKSSAATTEDVASEAYLARYASPAVVEPRLAMIQGKDDLDTGMRVAGILSHHVQIDLSDMNKGLRAIHKVRRAVSGQ